eukprot:591969-Rhodomonas_salina.1
MLPFTAQMLPFTAQMLPFTDAKRIHHMSPTLTLTGVWRSVHHDVLSRKGRGHVLRDRGAPHAGQGRWRVRG